MYMVYLAELLDALRLGEGLVDIRLGICGGNIHSQSLEVKESNLKLDCKAKGHCGSNWMW